MTTPDYVVRVRKRIGHDLLWLPSVSAVIVNGAGEVLLGKRTDDGRWSVISGIVEPGEQPASTIVREVREETGLDVEPERLTSVMAHPHTYPNGDRCEFLNLGFRCRPIGGTARVNDDESVAIRWFRRDQLPRLDEHARLTLDHALRDTAKTWYALSTPEDWDTTVPGSVSV